MGGRSQKKTGSRRRRRSRYGPGEWFLAALGLAVIVMVIGIVVSAIIQ